MKTTPAGALMRHPRIRPKSAAFVFHEEVWTYERLAAEAERLARGLAARSVGAPFVLRGGFGAADTVLDAIERSEILRNVVTRLASYQGPRTSQDNRRICSTMP
jgi:acyl-CoA synthetase (AMP-forming)/AMP-acid ligase II